MSEDDTQGLSPMKSLKWENFLKLMRDMGFSYDLSTAESGPVRFDPPREGDRPITFHKPHPDSTLRPVILKEFAKKLNAYYGWSSDFRFTSMSVPNTSVEARAEISEGVCVLTYNPLNTNDIIQSVQNDGAGAIAVFIGTTRNSFKGKVVTRLEYQAYSKLAIKTMVEIVRTAHNTVTRSNHHPAPNTVPSLVSCTVHHRLGTVPVGEPSIVIAVSSPHRKEAFIACEQILEEVKQKAQIWKREYYEGEKEEEAEWKANNS
ncbi:Molybdopterin biosynthesis MoaE [Hygrophoropsis aurantiaca]|uniref:Molybdopterin biosynthesis MoaE n=1 Tax=Hygrophoropsis aurantiaca TaxID=72124 RepID=A0ACB8AUP2_9AGAM|nr:Molybdopterin biosynthesis MoaE [Hygrophoropsis aurantiaca]